MKSYMHREWERMQDVEEIKATEELQTFSGKTQKSTEILSINQDDPKKLARQILGVSEFVSHEELRSTYERLYIRSTPSNFQEGSEEQKIAGEIHQKVKWAYDQLEQELNPTVKRFRLLEIEPE